MFKRSLWLLTVVGLVCSGQVYSLDTSLAARLGAEHTDNANLTSDGERSEFEQRAAVDLGLTHEGSEIQADISYQASKTKFDKGTQEDSTTFVGDASVIYEQIEKTLIWSLSNTRRNVIKDQSLNDLQDNREDRSISTGEVTFILRPSGVDSLETSLDYSDVSYEDSEQQDSDRSGASLAWRRNLSKVDSMSITGSFQDVGFENDANDYEYYSAGVGYSAALSKLSYDIFIGYNEQDRDGDTLNGGSYNANFNYTDSGSSWDLALLQRLTDTSRGNNNQSVSELGLTANAGATVDSYEITSAELKYSNSVLCGSCTLDVSFLAVEEDYNLLEDDNVELSLFTRLSYRFTARTNFSGSVRYRDLQFKGLNTRNDYDLVEYRLAMDQDLLKDLRLSLFVRLQEKSSDVVIEEFDEARGGLSLRYTFR